MKNFGSITANKDVVTKEYADSLVSVSSTGTSSQLANYITVQGTEYKINGGGGGGSSPDDVTINLNASSQLQVKDGGLTVAKMNSDAVSTTVEKTSPVDTKVTTEKAVVDYVTTFMKKITAAEYAALSEEEKLNGTIYMIVG